MKSFFLRKFTYLLRVSFFRREGVGHLASAGALAAPAEGLGRRSSISSWMSFTVTGEIYFTSFKVKHSRGGSRDNSLDGCVSNSVVGAWLGSAAGSGRAVFIFGGGVRCPLALSVRDARMAAESRGDWAWVRERSRVPQHLVNLSEPVDNAFTF